MRRFCFWNTGRDSSYKKKLKRKLSGIGFKRCSGLTITTDLNQYTNIISATKAVKKRWDIVLIEERAGQIPQNGLAPVMRFQSKQ
ncbi:MAG: hypothetical protein OCU22_01105 [Canidatus Methanoxibalbensis ujae]|nr:hypothetical protein [Candidatus Methanoxibalbensis ujae]